VLGQCGRVDDGYQVDDDPDRIDLDAVCAFLRTEAYWGRWRPDEVIRAQARAAWRVVGAYGPDGAQVGFARALSDGYALAYLADVYVLDAHRGHGLGKRIVRKMIDEGPGAKFRWMLHTADAHGLYERFGFAPPDGTYLERPGTPGT
jgi:GNAT superfamily N-acetyltransferase